MLSLSEIDFRGQLDFSLEEIADINTVSPYLIPRERREYRDLVELVARMTAVYTGEVRSNRSTLGLSCAANAHQVRSYLVSLMTASAVIESRKKFQNAPTVVVMGMGSGIDSVAALLTDSEARVIAYERDQMSVNFARLLFELYNVQDRIDIRQEDFLEADMRGVRADVVVNENIDTALAEEPQLEAAQKILPYTHEKTLFVPGGVDVYIEGPFKTEKTIYFGRIDFSKQYGSPIVFSHVFKPGELPSDDNLHLKVITDLVDYKGERFLKVKGEGVPFLNLSKLLNWSVPKLDSSLGYRMDVRFKFPSPRQPTSAHQVMSLTPVDSTNRVSHQSGIWKG